jgi:hypothetical protein
MHNTSGDVFHEAWSARGLAAADIWKDGHVDVAVTTNGGPSYILRNEAVTCNHWLGIKLVGHKSNRDGIGAEIKLATSKSAQLVTCPPRAVICHRTISGRDSAWVAMRWRRSSKSAGQVGGADALGRTRRPRAPKRYSSPTLERNGFVAWLEIGTMVSPSGKTSGGARLLLC